VNVGKHSLVPPHDKANADPALAESKCLWIGWLPLLVLPIGAFTLRNRVAPWELMWLLAFTIFISLKWLTWWKARGEAVGSTRRSVAYLLGWPGMDAESFLRERRVPKPSRSKWVWATFETTLGAMILWGVARGLPSGHPLLVGWVGMLGLILLLHFGTFQIVALVWQSLGIEAVSIMSAPLRYRSLADFWGNRWNLGFRQLSHDLIFRPLHKSLGPGPTSFLVFLLSGLIHDLVISLPARAGYGLPTAYFVLQGIGVTAERSSWGRRVGLGSGTLGRLFAIVVIAGPAFYLFHPWFVLRVIIPFMYAIRAL
jgi:Membrane bound O-acyl transferase family